MTLGAPKPIHRVRRSADSVSVLDKQSPLVHAIARTPARIHSLEPDATSDPLSYGSS